jgi:hypothetical protein
MYWWQSVPLQRGSSGWFMRNRAATKLLRQETTVLKSGGFRKVDHVIRYAYLALPGSTLHNCIMLPEEAPPSDEIINDAADALGDGRATVVTDGKRRFIASCSTASTPVEQEQCDRDLVWASMKYL